MSSDFEALTQLNVQIGIAEAEGYKETLEQILAPVLAFSTRQRHLLAEGRVSAPKRGRSMSLSAVFPAKSAVLGALGKAPERLHGAGDGAPH